MVAADKGVPDGVPKSGRIWKTKQTARSSSQLRKGILKNQSKTYEEREAIRLQKLKVHELEKEMKEETIQKRETEKQRRLERKKRIMEAEFKNTSYQMLNAEKLKTMSKKQLRMVKKTTMNKNGQIELVSPWTSVSASSSQKTTKKRTGTK